MVQLQQLRTGARYEFKSLHQCANVSKLKVRKGLLPTFVGGLFAPLNLNQCKRHRSRRIIVFQAAERRFYNLEEVKFNEEVLVLAVLYELEFNIYPKRMVLRVMISEMFTRRKKMYPLH